MVQYNKGGWIECVTRDNIETGLLRKNEERFTQSKGTPILVSPFVDMMGIYTNTPPPPVRSILEGEYEYH